MAQHRFEELEIWKRSARLASDLCVALNTSKQFAIRDQIQRSAISIPSNIAEGSERDSNKDFQRFLKYSKASCAELRTQLLIYKDISQKTNETNIPDLDSKIKETRELSAMLQSFINKLNPTT